MMALQSFNITSTFSSIFVVILFCNFSHNLAKQGNTKSMILGLSHARTSLLIPKTSTHHSRKKPSEMLDMMEPLREIRDGYLISLSLGTPPQVIQVYMDTGSDLTWVPCGNLYFDCMECEDYYNHNNKLMPPFAPTYSSTSARDVCGSSFCSNVHSSDNSFDTCTMAGCSLSTLVRSTCYRPCPSFAYTYAGGVVTGTLTRDVLRVHGSISYPNTTREVPRFCFGCVGSTYREPIGIVGFGRGPLSLPSQLGTQKLKGFSHCFLPFKFANNPNISSPLVVGDLAISSNDINLLYTPMLNSAMYPNYYYIGLEAISIDHSGNTSTIVTQNLREIDSQGNGGMLIDSGTTYTHLPEPLYSQVLSTLRSVINYPRAEEIEMRTGFDLCYKVPWMISNSTNNSSNSINIDDVDLPIITFHFLNKVSVVLPQGNNFYAMGAPRNSSVVKCFLFQSMDNDGNYYGPAGVFGSFQQQNMKVVYDLGKERIGFQPMDCASPAAFQGLH